MKTKKRKGCGVGLRICRRDRERRARRQKGVLEKRLPGYLFSAREFGEAKVGDYLKEIFRALPEETILRALPSSAHAVLRRGRRPYPRRALLRALFAGQALRIPGYGALAERMESDLLLKHACGFDIARSGPSRDTFERFARFLGEHRSVLQEAHDEMVQQLIPVLPGLGESTSWDSSHLPVVRPSEGAKSATLRPAEGEDGTGCGEGGQKSGKKPGKVRGQRGRGTKEKNTALKQEAKSAAELSESPLEATWGVKTYESVETKKIRLSNGETVEGIQVKEVKTKRFGGKMHVIVDNHYHLPLRIEVTPENQADALMMAPMYRDLCARQRCMEVHFAMADKALDSQEIHRTLVEELGIVPIIPLREYANREAPADPRQEFPKTVYDRERVTHVLDPRTGKFEECVPWGYDDSRQALKYHCPCERMRRERRLGPKEVCPFYGSRCGASRGEFPFSFWVRLAEHWCYYCPLPRESKRWKELYKCRTTVERLNSLTKGPLQLASRRARSLTPLAAEAHLAALYLCARAKVALRRRAPEKVGTAVGSIPDRRYLLTS